MKPKKNLNNNFDLWAFYSRFYDSVFNKIVPYRLLMKEVARRLELSPGCSVLDLGCGTGNVYAHFPLNIPVSVTGVDSSAHMLNVARSKYKDRGKVSFVHQDVDMPLGLPGKEFDRICCINALYAVKNKKKLLKEAYRLLKPGGKIVVVDPTTDTKVQEIFIEHCRKEPFTHFLKNIGLAISLFMVGIINMIIFFKVRTKVFAFSSEKELREMFKEAGFSIVNVEIAYAGQALLVEAVKNAERMCDPI